jgi:hypothetical protein
MRRGGGGPPGWLIVLIAGAFVFGFFYVVQGVQTFFRTGGLGVVEATERAIIVASATAVRVTRMATSALVPQATFTPPPECIDFTVTTASAVVREGPSFNAAPVTSLRGGEIVCVLEQIGEWYAIDSNTDTRRREIAYMHESIIAAVNPTDTPAPTQPPTPTLPPSETPLASSTPRPTLPPRLATVTPQAGETRSLPDASRTPRPPTALPARAPSETAAPPATLPLATPPLLQSA